MKSNILRRAIALLLSLMTVISIMSIPMTASARYTDTDIENKISYDSLNCREDDCDCLEPQNNKFAVVSPVPVSGDQTAYVMVDTYQNVQKEFNDRGWTDGLPIIPPTWIKAEKFMRYTSYSYNDVVATIDGTNITAYNVAVNAIMSGASAEYLPVCIAFVQALGNEDYLNSLRSGELTPMLYVNGPIARQLGIDNAQGMTTEECNISIARFMELALINLAGIGYDKTNGRNNAFGNVQPLVFSEDEQNCLNIGWDPRHVEEGYDLNENVVTATSFSMWGNNVTPATDLPEEIMKVMAWDITEKNLGGLGGKSIEENADTHRLVFITPSVASALSKKYTSKDALETALVEAARRPLWMRTYAYYYSNIGSNLIGEKTFSEVYDELKETSSEDAQKTASPAWMNGITYAEIDTVATMKKGNTDFIIHGDESRNKTQVMPGGVSVSQEISLPTNWDELLASMVVSIVYPSLSACEIAPVDTSVKLPSADALPSVLHVTTNRTYRIVASETYVKGVTNIYYDSALSTLYYYDGSAKQSIVLDKDTYSDFIAFVEALGINSSFTVTKNTNVISAVYMRFSSNASLPDKNMVVLTADTFGSVVPTVAANTSSGQNGNASLDGSIITMSADLTKFNADLGGTIITGDTTADSFVKVNSSTVTVDPSVEAGATAIIGVDAGDGTYRTMTFVNGGDGTYTITYNSAGTLSLTSSAYYLKGTFNNWSATDSFVKTDNPDILVINKELTAGTYTFKVHDAGTDTWYGNGGTLTDTAQRWTMDSSDDCTITATGGLYEFKYEISTNKLSVYKAQTDAAATPTTKTVYVGVIEYITDFVPALHYWNNSTGLAGDATLVATGETHQYSVGSDYWSNAKQNFKVYKTEIPVAANGMKTYNKASNNCWAVEEVNAGEDQILLVFEWGTNSDNSKIYHNVLATRTTQVPTEAPTTAPTQAPTAAPTAAPTQAPTEAPTQAPTEPPVKYCEEGYYIVGSFSGADMWSLDKVTADMKLTANTNVSGEYIINYDLAENDEFKVIYTDGYEITKWYPSGSDGYKVPATEAGEDKAIYFRPAGNSAWTNTYIYVEPNAVQTTVYLINSKDWTTVNAYAWTEGGAEAAKWPGTAMTKTSETVNGHDVYSATFNQAYGSIIFNNGTSQTADLTLEADKYYDLGTNKWYASLNDVPVEEESSDYITVYFQNNWNWTDVHIHIWDSALVADTTWPGKAMDKVGNNGSYDIYKYTIPADAKFIINGIKDDGSGSRDQSPDITSGADDGACYSMTWNGENDVEVNDISTVYPDAVPITPSGIYKTIYFLDSTSGSYIQNDDANMFVYSNAGDKVKMTQSIDKKKGKNIWTAKIDEAATSVTFYRASYFFDEDNASDTQWGTWSAGKPTTSIYNATGSGNGSWVADTTAAVPTGTMEDFWYGLWIDTKGDGNTVDAIKWYKNGSQYHFYVPSYVDLTKVKVYSSFDSFEIDGTDYNNGDEVNLSVGSHTVYATTNSSTTNLGTLKVYQTVDTAAMLMTTKEELFTGTTATSDGTDGLAGSKAWPEGSGITADNYNSVYKDAIETKGSYYFYDEEGNIVNSDPVLKKIKGRGNSSFEASMRVYGKYAYNFNLDSKVALIDGSTASKKWCLLANNVDHAMMRNTFIYALADDIGIKYAPETRLVDLYDNGKYLGAYIVTEKVEYGKNTMMSDMKNLDDGNEDANIEAYKNEDIMDDLEGHLVQAETSVTVNSQKYTYQYTKSDDETIWPYHQPSNFKEYNFLLEFELYDRYKAEASWFVSPRTGQAVVVKYPEFATKDEMEWIIGEYEKAESAIYDGSTDDIKAAVDVDSFAKMYLLQELAINLDSCATSYYIHNDLASGKLVSSPVWDYDWAFGAYANQSGKKYIFNGSTTVDNSTTMDNPEQMFVKKKALRTDSEQTGYKHNYNFQAKLVQNSYVWERCQYIWTNQMVDALNNYIVNPSISGDTTGIIEDEWLDKFESSVNMNNARWGSLTFTGDNWGTKITSNYNDGSFEFYVGDTSKSGTATASYANTVHYLNDWIAKRWDYMSSSATGKGNLYNADLKPQYEFDNVAFEGALSADGTQLTITPSCDVTYNGEAVDASKISWTVYVNGESVYNANMTQTSHTITLTESTNDVYVVYKVVDTDATEKTATQTFKVEIPEYKVENVTFDGQLSDDGSQLKVTPSATVTYGGQEVAKKDYQYYIYLNNQLAAGPVLGNVAYTTIDLEYGVLNEVYVKVVPVADETKSATSITQKFAYGIEYENVSVTVNFKSSSSYRYIPTLTVNGTTYKMTASGDAISMNASQTQSYYWYTATVEISKDVNTEFLFKNKYSMNAKTTVTASGDKTYYFAVDNLNFGTKVEDLTDVDVYIRNFVKSASNMISNDVYAASVATTSIDGQIYKMGDVYSDDDISIFDASAIQLALVQKNELSETSAALADYDLDSDITIFDATQIQLYLVNNG